MRKGPAEAGPKAANKKPKKHHTSAFRVLQTPLIVWPADDAWPHIRSLPSTDRQDVVDLWWEPRLQGVRLHPQAHVIVLPGWRR